MSSLRSMNSPMVTLPRVLANISVTKIYLHSNRRIKRDIFIVSPVFQHRCHSTSPHNTWWNNATRLIEAEIGSWTSQDWQLARDGLRHWNQEQKSSIHDSNTAWNLLDRTLREDEKKQVSISFLEMDYADLLFEFVCGWSDAPEKLSVQDVWYRLESLRTQGIFPTIASYNKVLNVAVKVGAPDAHIFVENALQTLRGTNVEPDLVTYAITMNALATSNASDAMQRAEVLFQSMMDMVAQGRAELQPNQILINTFITVCAKSSQPGGAKRAEELLRESPNPDHYTFSAVIHAWANNNAPDAPDRCYQTFNHMQMLYKIEGNLAVKPDSVCYGTLIAAFARRGRVQEAEKVLLEQIDEYERTKDRALIPNRINFNALIDAHAKSDKKGATQKAEALLVMMQTMAEESLNGDLFPDVVSFTTVLHAYAKSNDPNAANNAEALLKRMEELHKIGVPNMKPNQHSYSSVLACWAQTRSEQGAERAESILRLMIQRSKSGEDDIKPNSVCFSTVIDAIVKSRSRDAPERAESLLAEMERLSRDKANPFELNQYCFSTVITAWAQSRRQEACTRAEALIQRMMNMDASGQPGMNPSMFVYSSLLAVYASTSNPMKAFDLLNRLCDDFDSGKSKERPSDIAFSTVVSAFARSALSGNESRAQEVYLRMKKYGGRDGTFIFNALISAWGNSGNTLGPEKAEFYLNELKRQYAAGNKACKPNVIVYTSTINAWAKSHHTLAIKKATALLLEMKAQYNSGNHECRPNTLTYNSILTCLAKSRHADKATRALKIITEMEEMNLQPDTISYTRVLMACAFSSAYDPASRRKAFEIACQMLRRASTDGNKPTRLTFVYFFQAACDMGEDKAVEEAYEQCCRHGFQNDGLIKLILEKTAPPNQRPRFTIA